MSSTEGTGAPRRVKVEPGVYKRRDGKFEIGWRDAQGKQRWRVVHGGIKAARAALAAEHAARARDERIAADPRLRFADAAQAWIEARVSKMRPATQNAYGAGLAHLLRPEHFGRMRLTDITATDVARYISAQQAAGLKGWTIKGLLTVLSSIFNYAARHLGFAGTNPVTLLERIERPSSDDEKPKRILDPDELRRLLDAVDDEHRLIFELAAETGLRLGEALGIVWSDVDFTEQTVTTTHQLDRKGRRVPLKTRRSRRCLEVTPQLIGRLRAHKLASSRSGDHDLVLVNREGRPNDHRNIGGRVLTRAVKAAGLEAVVVDDEVMVPAPTFHSLRHSHASALIASGWDIEEVSARLGHTNVATTQRIYVHQFDAARRSGERRDRLAAIYGSVEAPMEAGEHNHTQQTAPAVGAEVLRLRAAGGIAQ